MTPFATLTFLALVLVVVPVVGCSDSDPSDAHVDASGEIDGFIEADRRVDFETSAEGDADAESDTGIDDADDGDAQGTNADATRDDMADIDSQPDTNDVADADGDGGDNVDAEDDISADAATDATTDGDLGDLAWTATLTDSYAWTNYMPGGTPTTIVVATISYENTGTVALWSITAQADVILVSDGATIIDAAWPPAGSFSGELLPGAVESVDYRFDGTVFTAHEHCGESVKLVIDVTSEAGSLQIESEPEGYGCPV